MARQNHRTVLRRLSDWLGNNQTFMHDEPRELVLNMFAANSMPSDQDKARIGSALDSLASWYYAKGLHEVLNGDTVGWLHLKQGVDYSYWHIRILVGCWERDPRRTKQARVLLVPSSLTLALAVLLGEQEAVSWLGSRLGRGVHDRAFGEWSGSPVPPHILRLWQRSCSQAESFAGLEQDAELQPHAAVFLHWEDEVALRQDIARMCDYHLGRAEDDSDDYLAEFAEHPYDVLPVEILLLYHVRRQMGKQTPAMDHPVWLISPEEVPKVLSPVDDPVLRIVIEKSSSTG